MALVQEHPPVAVFAPPASQRGLSRLSSDPTTFPATDTQALANTRAARRSSITGGGSGASTASPAPLHSPSPLPGRTSYTATPGGTLLNSSGSSSSAPRPVPPTLAVDEERRASSHLASTSSASTSPQGSGNSGAGGRTPDKVPARRNGVSGPLPPILSTSKPSPSQVNASPLDGLFAAHSPTSHEGGLTSAQTTKSSIVIPPPRPHSANKSTSAPTSPRSRTRLQWASTTIGGEDHLTGPPHPHGPPLSAPGLDILQSSIACLLEGEGSSGSANSVFETSSMGTRSATTTTTGGKPPLPSGFSTLNPTAMRSLPPLRKHLKPSSALRLVQGQAQREEREKDGGGGSPLGSPGGLTSNPSAWSLASSGSFDEDRVPGRVKLRIHAATFNMGNARPNKLPSSIMSTQRQDMADLYIIGSQESCPAAEWERMLLMVLGDKFVKVSSESLMSIHVVLFARKHLAGYILDVRTSLVPTGVGNVIGNKGGIGVAFTMGNAKVLVVTSHLAAHDDEVERRNADFHRIAGGLFSDPAPGATSERTTSGGQLLTEYSLGLPANDASSVYSEALTVGTSSALRTTPPGLMQTAPAALQQPHPPPAAVPRRGIMRLFNGRLSPSSTLTPAPSSPTSTASEADGPRRSVVRQNSSKSLSSMALSDAQRSLRPSGPQGSGPSFLGGLRTRGAAQLDSHDVVLWLGDLNYRINANVDSVMRLVDENLFEVLYANDQLRLQQKKGKAFADFEEQEICFPPTFKYQPGTHEYSGLRVPSWTDRILYKCNAPDDFVQLRPLYYHAVGDVTSSDHRPVVAGFELVVQPANYVPNDAVSMSKCVIA